MARNRVIPFGYCMKNGEITTEPKEVYAVAEIFREYLNGSSLLQIAKLMESENIRYTEDSDHWNKNMVKRIIENEKHLGTDKYPQIIDEDIFNQANEKRIRKANTLNLVCDDLQEIRKVTYCLECGEKLFRKTNGKGREYWNCGNPDCFKYEYRLTDQMIIGAVLTVLNTAIANSSLLEYGGAWRAYDFVEDTICLQQVGSETDFRTVAETLGKFQNQLEDYPASTLHETIARFHDTPNRYANFEKALAADALGRAKNITSEIEFIHAREQDCHVLLDQLAAGEIPLRVTHNDTKINNVLIDAATGKGICVIDLDTVMPGLSAYDFGDSIRTGANDCAEDEPDQSKVHFDLHLYEVFAKGYLSTAGASMSMAEKKSLAWGARLMTLECGIRFLTDYLEGDHYFHIARPDHNLDRARTQFTLVRQMEEVFDQMLEIVCPDNH